MINSIVCGKNYIATEDYYATRNSNSTILMRRGDSFRVTSFIDNECVKVEPRQNNYFVCGTPQREIKVDWDLFLEKSDREEEYSSDNYRKNWRREKEYSSV